MATALLSLSEGFLRSQDLKDIVEAKDEVAMQSAMKKVQKVFQGWSTDLFPTYLPQETWNNRSEDAVRVWYNQLRMVYK